MMNTKEQLASFDQNVNFHIANKKWEQLATYLVEILGLGDVICSNRKYTIRSILHSNLTVFKQVFLALNQSAETFCGVNTFKNVIPSNLHSQLTSLFQKKISNSLIIFTRIDGRRRLFVENSKLLDIERNIFNEIIEEINTNKNEIELEKVLFERISPIDVTNIDNSYWHIDALRDQLKIVIPINNLHYQNAPMKYISNVSHLDDYDNEIWQKLHTIYKISGFSVSKANYFEERLIESYDICSTEAQVGDLILFNPQIIHTGSLCSQGTRDSITLYYNVNTQRNRCFQKIHKIK